MLKKIIAGATQNIERVNQLLRSAGLMGNIIAGDLLPIIQRMLPVSESELAKPELATKPELLPEMNWHGVTFKAIQAANNALVGSLAKKDNPPHKVTLKPFYMMETTVTNKLWKKISMDERFKGILPEDPSTISGSEFAPDNHPVVNVSGINSAKYTLLMNIDDPAVSQNIKDQIWTEAEGFKIEDKDLQAFMNRMREEKQEMFILPTESEWEYAARGKEAGSSTYYIWGDDISEIDSYAHTSINKSLSSTQPVGLLKANEFGLKDMSGNVWEWATDKYSDSTFRLDGSYDNPKGPNKGNSHVIRGGSWYYNNDSYLQTAFRYYYDPDYSYNDVGFRPVRTIR